MSRLPKGSVGIIDRVEGDFADWLTDLGFIPKRQIMVVCVLFGSIVCCMGGTTFALRQKEADCVLIWS
jgi:Fe2+ transport system protein FeoA